jgi:hypothetical protein
MYAPNLDTPAMYAPNLDKPAMYVPNLDTPAVYTSSPPQLLADNLENCAAS